MYYTEGDIYRSRLRGASFKKIAEANACSIEEVIHAYDTYVQHRNEKDIEYKRLLKMSGQYSHLYPKKKK